MRHSTLPVGARGRTCRLVGAGALLLTTAASGQAQLSFEQALELRRPGSLALSPDGSMIAYVVSMARLETNAYEATLYVGPSTGGEPRALARAEAIAAVDWSADGTMLTYLARSSGPYQAWAARLDGSPPRQLSRHPTGVAAGMKDEYVDLLKPLRLSPDGTRAIYAVRDSVAALRKWDAQKARHLVFTPDMAMWALRRWMRQPAAAPQLWLVDLATGEERRVWTASESPLSPMPIEFDWSPDGRQIAVLYEYTGDAWIRRKRLAVLSAETLEVREALPQLGWTFDLSWTADSRSVRFFSQGVVSEPGDVRYAMHRYEYDIDADRLTAVDGVAPFAQPYSADIERVTGDLVHSCTPDPRSSRVACVREAGTVPPEVVTYRLTARGVAGPATVLTDLNPELSHVRLGRVEPLRWQRVNGDTGTSGLVLPVDYTPGRQVPLVVMQYNQYVPGRFYATTGFTSYAPQAFAARGYAVLLQNNPHNVHSYPPGDFETARAREADGVALSLRAMIDTLVVRGVVDTTRMGIMGWSWGGFFTPYILTQYPTWFHAGAQGEGGNHQPSGYWMEGPAWRAQEDRYFGGGPYSERADRWRAVAPIHNVDKLRAPLLMEYSPAYMFGIELQRAIVDQGGQTELIIYHDEDHVFSRPVNRFDSMVRHYDWFNFWLLDEEDPDPAKRDQYSRWRAMREGLTARLSTLPQAAR